jgi:predicted aspartyl protease
MPEYDRSFHPPAPVIQVEVRNPSTGASVQLRAQIDSGTSITVLPVSAAARLGLSATGAIEARGFDLTPLKLPTFLVMMLIDGFVILNAEVAATGRDDMLLGRDVLQNFILTLNGKTETFDLIDP